MSAVPFVHVPDCAPEHGLCNSAIAGTPVQGVQEVRCTEPEAYMYRVWTTGVGL